MGREEKRGKNIGKINMEKTVRLNNLPSLPI